MPTLSVFQSTFRNITKASKEPLSLPTLALLALVQPHPPDNPQPSTIAGAHHTQRSNRTHLNLFQNIQPNVVIILSFLFTALYSPDHRLHTRQSRNIPPLT